MQKKKVLILSILFFLLYIFLPYQVVNASTQYPILKEGMVSQAVKKLQFDLKKLGFFHASPTGYFGHTTKSAVIKLQKKYGLVSDGIVGPKTYQIIKKLLRKTKPSRGQIVSRPLLLPWFENVENIFYIGAIAKVIDVDTGLSFYVKRTYGYNHADVETLTAIDTNILKNIYGGEWSWERRAIIVIINGKHIAASMNGMPHAGREDLPAETWVNDWRSGGYGPGYNLDKIKNNNFEGHICIHFLNSKTHGTNKVDEKHLTMVYKAARSYLPN